MNLYETYKDIIDHTLTTQMANAYDFRFRLATTYTNLEDHKDMLINDMCHKIATTLWHPANMNNTKMYKISTDFSSEYMYGMLYVWKIPYTTIQQKVDSYKPEFKRIYIEWKKREMEGDFE